MYTQWIENCVVQRVSVCEGLVLDLDDYNEIVTSCPLTLPLPAVDKFPVESVRIDPLRITAYERPLLDSAGAGGIVKTCGSGCFRRPPFRLTRSVRWA